MAEPEVVIADGEVEADEDMGEVEEQVEAGGDEEENGDGAGLENIEPNIPERTTFLDHLRSPVVELVLGGEAEPTVLHAHQSLLAQSPYFAGECSRFNDAGPRRILLPDEDVDAAAAVVEYLYKGDYFPGLASSSSLESDASVPAPDEEGVGLLRHARVYTLAQKLVLPALAGLAHKKIHLTNSTARGELAYARYVYSETSAGDEAIRKPVAAFWAARSHILRHQAEVDFRRVCLDFPQFGFDVLNLILDQQEKRSQRAEALSSAPGSTGRKRQRVSGIEISR